MPEKPAAAVVHTGKQMVYAPERSRAAGVHSKQVRLVSLISCSNAVVGLVAQGDIDDGISRLQRDSWDYLSTFS